tara:strand:+ start:358 stop:564 length:207 start_codon:yes stop_codon:yes gene_type:complete
MKKLDLHGVRHQEVERLVENLVLLNDSWKIICGNSDKMIEIVQDKLNWTYDNHGVEWYKPTHNSFSSI